jgi:hypothetical protein
MKTIQTLSKGETLLTSVRKVNGGKFQIEIAEFVENPNAKVNVASLLNAGDDRFSNATGKPRMAWQSATPEGLFKAFGLDVTKLTFNDVNGKETATVNMLNPTISGERLHVRIVDSLEKSYEGQQPKQVIDSKTGVKTFFMKDGANIYSSTQIVAGEPVHAIIASSERVAAGQVVSKASAVHALNA